MSITNQATQKMVENIIEGVTPPKKVEVSENTGSMYLVGVPEFLGGGCNLVASNAIKVTPTGELLEKDKRVYSDNYRPPLYQTDVRFIIGGCSSFNEEQLPQQSKTITLVGNFISSKNYTADNMTDLDELLKDAGFDSYATPLNVSCSFWANDMQDIDNIIGSVCGIYSDNGSVGFTVVRHATGGSIYVQTYRSASSIWYSGFKNVFYSVKVKSRQLL